MSEADHGVGVKVGNGVGLSAGVGGGVGESQGVGLSASVGSGVGVIQGVGLSASVGGGVKVIEGVGPPVPGVVVAGGGGLEDGASGVKVGNGVPLADGASVKVGNGVGLAVGNAVAARDGSGVAVGVMAGMISRAVNTTAPFPDPVKTCTPLAESNMVSTIVYVPGGTSAGN